MALTNKDREEIKEMIKEAVGGKTSTSIDFDKWHHDGKYSASTDVVIAPEDYYEILPDGTAKTKFTWDEAMEIEKKLPEPWHIPTRHEWVMIAEEFGYDEEHDKLDPEMFKEKLDLETDAFGYGHWWASSVLSDTDAYYLDLDASNMYPQFYGNKGYSFALRCVAR